MTQDYRHLKVYWDQPHKPSCSQISVCIQPRCIKMVFIYYFRLFLIISYLKLFIKMLICYHITLRTLPLHIRCWSCGIIIYLWSRYRATKYDCTGDPDVYTSTNFNIQAIRLGYHLKSGNVRWKEMCTVDTHVLGFNNCSAYDKDWKFSGHSLSSANFIKLSLIIYRKFVWTKKLVRQMLNLARKCLVTGHYHKPWFSTSLFAITGM